MSWQALAWAAKQKAGSLANKAVLLAMANVADEAGECHPSTAYLAEVAECDAKTITVALDRLCACGLIAETGERAGRTKQIKVYRLSLESHPETEGIQKRKASGFSGKDPQKRGTDTVRDTTPQKATPSSVARKPAPAFVLPSDIPEAEWEAFDEMRRKGKAKAAWTDRARQLAVNELRRLAEAGHPPGEVLNQSTLNGWAGVFPLKDRNNAGNRTGGNIARFPQRRTVAEGIAAQRDRVAFMG